MKIELYIFCFGITSIFIFLIAAVFGLIVGNFGNGGACGCCGAFNLSFSFFF